MKINFLPFLILLVLCLVACGEKEVSPKDKLASLNYEIINDWNLIATSAAAGNDHNPLLVSRALAITHIAIHDVINSIVPKYKTYCSTGLEPNADPKSAIASAAYESLIYLCPDQKEYLDENLHEYLDPIKDNESKTLGVALGKKVANSIILLRKDDDVNQNFNETVTKSNIPGLYQPIPPATTVFGPYWRNVKPFALTSNSQFKPAPPIALSTAEYATNFAEVMQFGSKNSTVRSESQSAYSKFWYDFAEKGWNRIARIALIDQKTDVVESARILALLNIALADGYIAGYEAKYYYNYWRPYTAIHNADGDGNSATDIDASWESFLETPAVQDYPSTHSILGNAAAVILSNTLGENLSFTVRLTSSDAGDSKRDFTSFKQAAEENADSRVMAGIHFRFSCEAGKTMGDKIGAWTVANYLQPVD
jgi:hypothetical protein